jgi:hypothetical protein
MVHQGYINHVGLVLDASGSMNSLRHSTVRVADMQVQYLAQRSQEMDQETRATVYQFDTKVECLYYDKDVLRLPSIANLYRIGGQTALIDATLKAITDLQQTATLYGDHAFLLYVLTDGLENASHGTVNDLSRTLTFLPDNWTIAVFVPSAIAVHEAKKLGFAPGNIAVWDTSEKGIQEVGRVIQRTTDAYMHARSQGIRSTTGLFNLDTQGLTTTVVRGNLLEVPRESYHTLRVFYEGQIGDFVRSQLGTYRKGSAFYQLSKPEKVQPQKIVAVRDIETNRLYSGHAARQLLGLPDYEVKVASVDHPKYDIFIQSTSVNRKLVPGTDVIVLNR